MRFFIFFFLIILSYAKLYMELPEKPFEIIDIKGEKPGKKILIIGGIHGNEIGGYKSADILRNLKIKNGEILLIPRINFTAILANVRGYNGDMNQKFKYISLKDKDYIIVTKLKKIIKKFQPDLLLSLHDGYGFVSKNKNAWGQAIIIDEVKYKNFNLLKEAKYVQKLTNKNLKYKVAIKNTKTFSNPRDINKKVYMLTDWALRQNIKAISIEASKNIPFNEKIKTHLEMIKNFLNYYNIKSNINNLKYISPTKPQIVLKINNKTYNIKNSQAIIAPRNSKIKILKIIGPAGSYVVGQGINLNWKSFYFKNVKFNVKVDNKTFYSFRIKEANK